MGITYYEEERIFKLDTCNTSYLIGIVDTENFIGHIYYGKRLRTHEIGYLLRTEEQPKVPSINNRERLSFYDCFPMEYPTQGIGDYRLSCLQIRSDQGHRGVGLHYVSYEIMKGKPRLKGLPATFGKSEDCTTLILHCEDLDVGVKIQLMYTVFEELDVITRSVKVMNVGEQPIYLEKVLSASLSIDREDLEMITMHGSWARERHLQRMKVGHGHQGIGSIRGASSHQEHPFMALVTPDTTQEHGEVYAMHFVYSGNFIAQASLSQFDHVRAVMGIHPEGFTWKLRAGESFQAPEVVMIYSSQGLDGMTRNFHDLYRNHLIRGEYKDCQRPILINNWEATYFDFTTEKLLSIAKQAAAFGIEMLVMDDGWFGKRNFDDCALGDWVVNEEKLPGGLSHLVQEVNRLGLKFGIWFEPEMISLDSNLYHAHPDWAIQIPNRVPGLSRFQYVLDLSRKEIRDYIYEAVASILRSANIEYVKWDMNRQLSDLGSYCLDADCQGELYHRYVLGVYELQERLITEFPYLLLENCSGGGARFDPGMLYFSPQIWCSDDTDAIERLSIQESTAMIYPLSTMGAHVSDCPNHIVGRVTPFETRGYVALAGTFGYELDITKISSEDQAKIPEQVAMYHKYNDLIREGDYYRIASYQQNQEYDCWEVVAKDQSEVLVTWIHVLSRPNYHSKRICIKGLNPDARYQLEGTTEFYDGDALMYAGFLIQNPWGDYQGKLLHFIKVEDEKER